MFIYTKQSPIHSWGYYMIRVYWVLCQSCHSHELHLVHSLLDYIRLKQYIVPVFKEVFDKKKPGYCIGVLLSVFYSPDDLTDQADILCKGLTYGNGVPSPTRG